MLAEIIRWQTPVIHMRRTLSGNHDQAVFDDPDQLAIDHPHTRADAAFGLGVQRCSGNRLAERQLRILMGRDYGALA